MHASKYLLAVNFQVQLGIRRVDPRPGERVFIGVDIWVQTSHRKRRLYRLYTYNIMNMYV